MYIDECTSFMLRLQKKNVLLSQKQCRNAVSFQTSTRPAARTKHCHSLPKEKREISDHGADCKNRETSVIRQQAETEDI